MSIKPDFSKTIELNQVGTDFDWKTIHLGTGSSYGIKNNGTLWAWGYNVAGQLGDGSFTDRNIPVQIGIDTTWIKISGSFAMTGQKADSTVWYWGADQNNVDKFYSNVPKLAYKITKNMTFLFASDPPNVATKQNFTKKIHYCGYKDFCTFSINIPYNFVNEIKFNLNYFYAIPDDSYHVTLENLFGELICDARFASPLIKLKPAKPIENGTYILRIVNADQVFINIISFIRD
jgi:Regulator of chromosome condensation (RCC1) repeat